MATKVPFSEGKSVLKKSIIEMSMDGDEPPSQFHVVEGIDNSKLNGSEDHRSSPQEFPNTIPIIDLSLLTSEEESELEKLRSALSSVGCFQVIGHGMSISYLDKARQVGKQFFALPEEEKQKYARALNEFEGYGTDTLVTEKQVLDWSYRLTLQVFPKEKRRLSFWPQNPTEFSEVLEEFSEKVMTLAESLLRGMARSLNLEENSFLDLFGKQPSVLARCNFYPRCSRPNLVLGSKAHTDGSGITILLQDEVEGLQFLFNDKWITVPTIPDAFIVNVGDQMQIMSNGIFKSRLHRVKTNTEKLRMSFGMFYTPDAEIEYGPVESLISETQPRMYRKIKDYVAHNYRCYQEGKIPLDTVRIAVDDSDMK